MCVEEGGGERSREYQGGAHHRAGHEAAKDLAMREILEEWLELGGPHEDEHVHGRLKQRLREPEKHYFMVLL